MKIIYNMNKRKTKCDLRRSSASSNNNKRGEENIEQDSLIATWMHNKIKIGQRSHTHTPVATTHDTPPRKLAITSGEIDGP